MRVLVTGGAGFIGSHVVDALVRAGHAVWVVDNLSHGRRDFVPPAATFVEGDVLRWREWVDQVGRVEAVIHLAAQISVPVSEEHPEEDVRANVVGTVAMLQAARVLGARAFRFASSAAVYGDHPALPLVEESAGAPLSYYGLDKWVAESYIRHEAHRSGLITTILRLANVYGPRQRTQGEGGVIALFAEALAAGRTPVIFGDGLQTRDFIAVSDVARAFVHRLGDAAAGGTFNIGTETAVTVLEVWRLLAHAAGCPPEAVQRGPDRPGDIRHSRLAVGRARKWGFSAATPLGEGLAETLQYFRQVARG